MAAQDTSHRNGVPDGRGRALVLCGVSSGYGDTVVLEDVSLSLSAGESVSIIGRNGVGKTTLLATVMGHTKLHGGQIYLNNSELSRLSVHERVLAGLGYVPQEREIFPSLSVLENLAVAAQPGGWSSASVFELFPQLADRSTHQGNQLSGGEQQMLSIGRALMGGPSVLMMDEPTEGLAPVIIEQLVKAIHRLRTRSGLSIVLVEQHSGIALAFSERTIVLDRGRIVYDGNSAALHSDPVRLASLMGLGGS